MLSKFQNVSQTVEIPLLVCGEGSGLEEWIKLIRKNFKGLIFRYVNRVNATQEDYLGAFLTRPSPSGNGEYEVAHIPKDASLPHLTEEEKNQRLEMHYSKFFFFTEKEALRPDTDPFAGKEVFCESRRFSQIDLFDKIDGKFSYDEKDRQCTIPPRPRDLVCILPVNSKRGPEAKFWFTCSEQFLKAWTLIVHPNSHESNVKLGMCRQRAYSDKEIKEHALALNEVLASGGSAEGYNEEQERIEIEKKRAAEGRLREIAEQIENGEVQEADVDGERKKLKGELEEKWKEVFSEEALRRKVFQGNFTMTNTYRKWCLSCMQNGLGSTDEELQKRFWNLRTETASRWVHIYCALVLMVRYREFPCIYNIPNVGGNGPFMKSWDLPDGWLERIVDRYNLLAETYTRQIKERIVPDDFLPAGTYKLDVPSTEEQNVDGEGVDVEEPNGGEGKIQDEVFIPTQNWGDTEIDTGIEEFLA